MCIWAGSSEFLLVADAVSLKNSCAGSNNPWAQKQLRTRSICCAHKDNYWFLAPQRVESSEYNQAALMIRLVESWLGTDCIMFFMDL